MKTCDSAELSNHVLPTWFGFATELHARLFETAKKTLAERFPELPDQAGSVDDLEDYWSPEANPPGTAAAQIENMANNNGDRMSEGVKADIQPAHMDVPLVMAAARIAATFFSMRDALPKMARPGSITVLETRDVQGIHELCSIISRGLFPQNIKVQQSKEPGQVLDMVHLIVPQVSEGSISDHGAKALVSEISAALANRNAMLIVVPNIDLIPMSLRKALSKPIRIAPISRDIFLFGISQVHPTVTQQVLREIAVILPNDLSLKTAESYHILAAFRQPSAVAVAQSLKEMLTSAQPQTGIEALRGSGELMLAAEQIVADLQAYGRGELQWKDIPRGLLLCGQPGTGKTFASSCIAASAQVAFIATTSGQWQSKGHLGDLLKAMRDDFARARSLAPCIMLVDELDSIGSRQSADSHGQSYRRQVITEFLAQIDGAEGAEGVMLIGATNHVEALDPALLRPGRFDRLIAVPLPDQKTLEQLLRHHLQADLQDLNLSGLARMARGNTPADIAGAVRLARARARAEKMQLSEAHLIHLLDRDYDLLPEKEWIVSLHEAGHALTCHLLNIGKVQEMRLDREGGLTRVYMSPITGTLQTIQNLMVYHLAGRAAELVVLNQVTAGSGGNEESDLAKATGLALQIERTFGLGANGLVWETASHPAQSRPMSMAERAIISGHLTAAQSHAVSLLQANVTSLVKLAKRLATKRHLESEEIEAVLRELCMKLGDGL